MSENANALAPLPGGKPIIPAQPAEGRTTAALVAGMGGLPSLSGALASARDRCRGASKDGKNAHHGYRYASADEIVATANDALDGSGLALLPVRQELTVSGSGALAFYALNRVVILSHSSGEATPLEVRGWPVIPERGRPLDKAMSIALTGSTAYLLRDLLQMPRGDRYDDEAAQDDRKTPVEAVPPAQRPRESEVETPTPPPADYAAASQSESPTEEEPRPNPPAPGPAGALTEAEYAELVTLGRASATAKADFPRILLALGVRVLKQAPRAKLDWLRRAIRDGLVGTAMVDRIAGLVQEKADATNNPGAYWGQFRDRLREVYGTDSVAHLLAGEADELEGKLARKSRPAAEPTPA